MCMSFATFSRRPFRIRWRARSFFLPVRRLKSVWEAGHGNRPAGIGVHRAVVIPFAAPDDAVPLLAAVERAWVRRVTPVRTLR